MIFTELRCGDHFGNECEDNVAKWDVMHEVYSGEMALSVCSIRAPNGGQKPTVSS